MNTQNERETDRQRGLQIQEETETDRHGQGERGRQVEREVLQCVQCDSCTLTRHIWPFTIHTMNTTQRETEGRGRGRRHLYKLVQLYTSAETFLILSKT